MHTPRAAELRLIIASLVTMFGSGCSDQPETTAPDRNKPAMRAELAQQPTGRHIVLFAAERVPADFGERVSRLGGSVEASVDDIGVAVVTGLSQAGAAGLATAADTRAVEPDPFIALHDDLAEVAGASAEATPAAVVTAADATASPTAAQYYPRQWNMRAVFADRAWAAGFLGSRDVVVAILDTGVDYLHPDLVGLVDLERSTSIVPEDVMPARYADRLPISDLFWHGTAVASIVASNAKVVAGVNLYVTLLAVKVADSTFRTSIGRIISGIVYAADQGADVINISRADTYDKSENPGLIAAVNRAANYAFRKGALIVTAADNDAADLDHNGDKVKLPCQAAHTLCVSATGPTDAAGPDGPWENVDAPAPYTAFGRSAIAVAAPGGVGLVGQFRRVVLPCTTTPTATTVPPACRARQFVALGGGFGTSFAAPHVSGLAALLVAQLGHGEPALIRERILQSADDLGEPGTDPFYGKGRINIARALGVLP